MASPYLWSLLPRGGSFDERGTLEPEDWSDATSLGGIEDAVVA